MPDENLTTLNLTETDVPSLPAPARNALVAYLLRWKHYDAAQQCLRELLRSHGRLVSVYDNLARLYLALDESDRALEIMRRRHAIRSSNTSQALEARVHLAAGDLISAQAILDRLRSEQPDLLLTWSLQADLSLAAGDLDAAEGAWHQYEALRPGATMAALGTARVWQARGGLDKALLWARTALARTARDEREPPTTLLSLLVELYKATGQDAQAESTRARLRQRQQDELDALRGKLRLVQPVDEALPLDPQVDTHTGEPYRKTIPCLEERPDSPPPPASMPGGVELSPDERARLDDALHRHFEHESFRPGQAEVVATLLRGESALAVMPTGAGKSLCYQLAALLLPGTTLVISPLIALMKDQIDGLPPDMAAQTTTLNSTLDSAELAGRLTRAAAGKYRLLFAAPERLRQRPFLHALGRARVSLLVVDEGHCVSLWGHDFRPDYLFIAKTWQELGQPPILALTATATPRVRDDIQGALGKTRLIATDIHRPNLCLEAHHFSGDAEKQRQLLALCRQLEGSGIVYARSRKKCEGLAAMLRRNGLSAIHYHAGIPDRHLAQDQFMSDQARIVVATIAFGMGIDKADVRFVIHYNPPKTLENYYQEAGRAGRDGLPAHCILFHTPGDKGVLSRFIRQEALEADFLRRVYAAIRRRVGNDGVSRVSVGDLERDLGADDTQIRVAVHFLETAGLLWRGFDLPRTATLTLKHTPECGDGDFARFVESSHLRHGEPVARDLLACSRDAGLDPRKIEALVLGWQDAGWLGYRGIGRDMLLALPVPPSDSQQRVAAMLADYRDGQDGRLAEMMAFARTTQCRHGHISAYFGGRPIEHCQACDNCVRKRSAPVRQTRHRQPAADQTPMGDRTLTILHGVASLSHPLGRTGLARALQGAASSPVPSTRLAQFGALSGMTQKRISQGITKLEDDGLLEPFSKGRYRLLRLTDKGERLLAGQGQQKPAHRPPAAPDETEAFRSEEPLDEQSTALYEDLRAWRIAVAKEADLPAFCVFHNATLKRIAGSRPTCLEQLDAIQGIGPRKLERYGSAVLAIVAGRDTGRSPEKA
jgi:ATP-dependent DNA helicase RecQ